MSKRRRLSFWGVAAGVLVAACLEDDFEIFTVLGAPGAVGPVGGARGSVYDVLSRNKFGDAVGQVSIGGQPTRVSTWSSDRIAVEIEADDVSGQIVVQRPDGQRIDGPQLYLGQSPSTLSLAWNNHVDQYAVTHHLPLNWSTFMKSAVPEPQHGNRSVRERYMRSFHKRQIERKVVSVAYYYHNDAPYPVITPWPDIPPEAQELKHMVALEEFLEAVYPTYRFELRYRGNRRQSDITVMAHHPNRNRFFGVFVPEWGRNEATIQAMNDGVLAHEIGHYLGLEHHYSDPSGSDAGSRQLMPPGDVSCTMDRTAGWCSGCLAALDIPLGRYDEQLVRGRLDELHAHYQH